MQAWDPELHFTKLKIQSCIKPRQNQTKPKTKQIPKIECMPQGSPN